jgi:hypothetical protein
MRVSSEPPTIRRRRSDPGIRVNPGRWLGLIAALILIVGSLAASGRDGELTPGSELVGAQTLPTVSPTPTPRVIVIDRPTPLPTPPPLPTPSPTATTAAGQESVIEIEDATPTPVGGATTTPSATATPFVIPTPAPTATATAVPPTPTIAIPTATATPQSPAAVPTIAPSPGRLVTFTAQDWEGGYYRGDSQAYGRPWVALYGAQSAYPRARLTFSLDADAAGETILTVTGLDDEWSAPNEISLEVNGVQVFAGPSPFPNWDGVGNGANAAWTSISFTIAPGILRAGPNTIEIANRTPGSNYNAPPYVLLTDATLQISGVPAQQTPPTNTNLPSQRELAAFTAEDWRGGYYRGDSQAYGRPWVALYGAQSAYPSATLNFRIRGEPGGPATLRLTGLDDELPDLNQMLVAVNGVQVYSGASPFVNWDGIGNGANAAWTEASITIPAGVLRSGRNEIAVSNLTPAASFNGPPYILLADAVIETQAGD